jgi:hypothetical protein
MTKRERWQRCLDDRAVSEALGFLLIFTMVIVGVGLVTLYGYPMLLRQQVTADEKIMEKNMIVLQNDLKSITYKTVPYKETSLQIGSSGTLFAYNSSSTYSAFNVYTGSTNYVTAFTPGDLRYFSNSADTDISLQNGAVVKRQHVETGSVMLAEPRWFYDSLTNTLVINLISINTSATRSRAGIGTVQMELGQTNYSYNTLAPGTSLYVSYVPDPNPDGQNYKEAWGSYFTQNMNMVKTALPNEYLFQPAPLNPGQNLILVIKRYEVIIDSL